MIMYIAAVASAVTLTITPVMAREDAQAGKKAEWIQPKNEMVCIKIHAPIEISGSTNAYVLSQQEQNILRKALLRSVKVVDRGRLA